MVNSVVTGHESTFKIKYVLPFFVNVHLKSKYYSKIQMHHLITQISDLGALKECRRIGCH